MSEDIVSDATLTERLRDVFGIENVASANHRTGYHEVYFPNKKAVTEVLSILDAQGFLNTMQSSGGWTAEKRPNIGIICGNENQRATDPGLNNAATRIIDILATHREAIRTAAGISGAKHRG